jgi:hypothetical protein
VASSSEANGCDAESELLGCERHFCDCESESEALTSDATLGTGNLSIQRLGRSFACNPRATAGTEVKANEFNRLGWRTEPGLRQQLRNLAKASARLAVRRAMLKPPAPESHDHGEAAARRL